MISTTHSTYPLVFVRVVQDGNDDGYGHLYQTLWKDCRYDNRYILCSSTWRTDPDETLLFQADSQGVVTDWIELWGLRYDSTRDHHKFVSDWGNAGFPEYNTSFDF